MDATSITLWLVLLLSVLLIAALIRRRAKLKQQVKTQGFSGSPASVEPDNPVPFGYKCAWYAVQNADVEQLVRLIGLKKPRRTTWLEGIEAAYGKSVFVSPAIDGWCFVVGARLVAAQAPSISGEIRPTLQRLSSELGTVCFFATHRVVELHIWAKAADGQVLRAYAYHGETGEVVWNEGKPTPEEVNVLGNVDEDAVMAIARAWSIAPVDLDTIKAEPSLGMLGTL